MLRVGDSRDEDFAYLGRDGLRAVPFSRRSRLELTDGGMPPTYHSMH